MAEYGKDQAPVELDAVVAQGYNTKILPYSVQENPSLAVGDDAAYNAAVDDQVQSIMQFFLAVVPSNYASQIKGPFYTMQFQAAAEQIARIQVAASEIFADADFDFTRPEFLYQIIGTLVFPDATTDGIPTLPSDLAQRRFIKDMAGILLKGATKSALYEAIKLLTDADVQIIEKSIESRGNPLSGYTMDEQFEFELNLSKTIRTTTVTKTTGALPTMEAHYHTIQVDQYGDGKTVETVFTESGVTGVSHVHDIYGWAVQPYVATATVPAHNHSVVSDFPSTDPAALLRNISLVLKAIKPAHTLYEYRNVFREVFGGTYTDAAKFDLNSAYYDDLRKYWWGAKSITGTAGVTLTDRTLFSDATRSFSNVNIGAALTILSGPNAVGASSTDQNTVGRYTVTDILTFPMPSDASVVTYTTSPTGLSGYLQITGSNTLQAMVFNVGQNKYIPNTAYDWTVISENEVLTITSGANAGSYRFEAFLGNNGGLVRVLTGKNGTQPAAIGPAYQVSMTPSLLRVDRRMRYAATGQQYEVVVDRLGVLTPNAVTNEDVSVYFAPHLGPLPPVPAYGPNPNFLYDSLAEPAAGVFTQSAFLTANGPLVKNWGDFTMATINDVTVEVNGVQVTVASIDPYIGRINLATPIQVTPVLAPPPVVTVSYHWMPKAIVDTAALNTVGLVLNQWDRAINHDNPPWHGAGQLGAVSTGSRFLLGTELGPVADQEPLYIGYRYLGLDRTYTASLNDPTTLLLNQDPNSFTTNEFKVIPEPASVNYEATTFPTLENWALVGADSGGLVGNGTYQVKSADAGAFGTGNPALYYQMANMTLPATGRIVVRFVVDPASVTPTGCFTGVGFGTHDNRRSYIVGLLLLTPYGTEAAFRSIGFLLDPARPDLRESWLIGPQTDSSVLNPQVVLTAQNKLVAKTAVIPQNIKAGTRFRIESGPQQGVYTVTNAVNQTPKETIVAQGQVQFTGQMSQAVTFPAPVAGTDYRVTYSFAPTGPAAYATDLTSTGFTLTLTGTTGYTGAIAYTVYQVVSTTTITIAGAFPTNIDNFNSKYQTLIWEVDYSVITTYVLTISTTTHKAALYCSGSLFGTFLTATASTPLAQPAQVGPLDFGYAGG